MLANLIVNALALGAKELLRQPVDETHRSLRLRCFSHYPYLQIFSKFVSGKKVDKPIDFTGFFFLPVKVPEVFNRFPAFNDQGDIVEGTFLIGDAELILDGENIAPLEVSLTRLVAILTIAFYTFLVILAFKGRSSTKMLILLNAPYFIFLGFVAVAVYFFALFSQHTFTWSNMQIFIVWPTEAVLGVFFLFSYCYGAQTINWVLSGAKWYALAHVVTIILVVLGNYFFSSQPQN